MTLIEVQKADSIARVYINNPARRNALSREVIVELRTTLEEIARSEERGILLSSHGPVFSSGHDFSDMAGKSAAEIKSLFVECEKLMLLLPQLPQPIVAQVQGPAIGAGAQLALSCDMIVASETASFITPGGQGGWFCTTPAVAVSRCVGQKRALEMLMSGDPISAQTALSWGMINHVIAPEGLEKFSLEFIARMIRGSRISKQTGKNAFYAQLNCSVQDAYKIATPIMAESAATPDAQETMRAFMEKRKPVFS